MVSMEKDSVDLIVTDPPFAINFKAKKANYNRISRPKRPTITGLARGFWKDITRFQKRNTTNSQRIGW